MKKKITYDPKPERLVRATDIPEYLKDSDAMMGWIEPFAEYVGESTQVFTDQDGNVETKTSGGWIKFGQPFLKQLKGLKGCQLSVFIALVLHMNKNYQCYPTTRTIARLTGYGNRQVLRAIEQLEARGFVTVEKKHRKANSYTIKAYAAVGKNNTPKEL